MLFVKGRVLKGLPNYLVLCFLIIAGISKVPVSHELDQRSANSGPGARCNHSLILLIELYVDTGTPTVYLGYLYIWLHCRKGVELSSCNRDHMTRKALTIYCLPFTEKCADLWVRCLFCFSVLRRRLAKCCSHMSCFPGNNHMFARDETESRGKPRDLFQT